MPGGGDPAVEPPVLPEGGGFGVSITPPIYRSYCLLCVKR